MSKENNLEGKGNALLVVLQDYITACAAVAVAEALVESKPPEKAEKAAAPAEDKKVDKADLKEKTAEAKQAAGKVMADLGKDVLAQLLADIGAKKFSEIKDPDDLQKFIEAATAALQDKPATESDGDLLGDDDEDNKAEEKTLDDVKDVLLQVNNHAELGREVTKQILGELGVRRLPELDAERYGEAYSAAKKALDNVG